MTAYALVLFLHSSVRWLVLATGLLLFLASVASGWRRRHWDRQAERLHAAFVGIVDAQLLLGLGLYLFLSPLARAFRADVAHAVHDHVLRFFGLEHGVTMLLAVAVVHVGRTRSKRASTPRLRYRRIAVSTATSLALFTSGIPWPGLRHGRPLTRGVPATPTSAAAAAVLRACPPGYGSNCAVCHGARGRGDGVAAASLVPSPRDFSDASWSRQRHDDELAAIIRDGGARHGLSAAMPPHPELSVTEVEAFVRCVRSFGLPPVR